MIQAKFGYRANILKVVSHFPADVQKSINQVIGHPENIVNTSNMFSAAVEARKGSNAN